MSAVISDPVDGTILSFAPDSRFTTVQFDGHRGNRLVISLSLRFIGWAVVAYRTDQGEVGTDLLAVGLDPQGRPFTRRNIAENFGLEEWQVTQTGLVPAPGAGLPEPEPWPDDIEPDTGALP